MSLLYNVTNHLLRNAVDHGIETAEERIQQGKSPRGCIQVSFNCLDQVVEVTFADDGRGLDLDKIRSIGIHRGLLNESESYREEDIAACILEPGFSTRNAVTDISGRGVGMDAVVREIEASGGKLQIALEPKTKRSGHGIRFIMLLPTHLFHFFRSLRA